MAVTFTGVYQQDVKLARQLNLFTGVNPKKVVLEGLIADYLSTVTTNTESDRPSLLPAPILKRDRVSVPAPILKRDRIVTVDPLKRPAPRPVKRVDRVVGPKPKLVKFNRNYFQ
jgi:hypothetical protein